MGDDSFLNASLILTRVIHFAACILIVGVCAFDRFIAPRVGEWGRDRQTWRRLARRMLAVALAAALLSGAGWFACVAMGMSGLSFRQTIGSDAMRIVWSQTRFGFTWEWRLILCVGAVIAAVPAFYVGKRLIQTVSIWLLFFFGAAMLATLVWAGHGQTGRIPSWHLLADFLHLLGAGFWPGALAPFAMVLRGLRRSTESNSAGQLADLTRRFSMMSLVIVAVLSTTGLINSYSLIDQPGDLFTTPYGRLLSMKIVLFLAMVCFGAMNLFWHRPRLALSDAGSSTIAKLQRNVWIELLLGAMVIAVVAALGLLPPTV